MALQRLLLVVSFICVYMNAHACMLIECVMSYLYNKQADHVESDLVVIVHLSSLFI